MRCNTCGYECAEGKFCSNCGAALTAAQEPAAAQESAAQESAKFEDFAAAAASSFADTVYESVEPDKPADGAEAAKAGADGADAPAKDNRFTIPAIDVENLPTWTPVLALVLGILSVIMLWSVGFRLFFGLFSIVVSLLYWNKCPKGSDQRTMLAVAMVLSSIGICIALLIAAVKSIIAWVIAL